MLRLDVEFSESSRVDGSLLVIAVDEGGPVAAAGGRVDDVWNTIDGVPARQILVEWQTGERIRQPDVPMTVAIVRDGERLTIYPAWREDEQQGSPPIAVQGAADEREPGASNEIDQVIIGLGLAGANGADLTEATAAEAAGQPVPPAVDGQADDELTVISQSVPEPPFVPPAEHGFAELVSSRWASTQAHPSMPARAAEPVAVPRSMVPSFRGSGWHLDRKRLLDAEVRRQAQEDRQPGMAQKYWDPFKEPDRW